MAKTGSKGYGGGGNKTKKDTWVTLIILENTKLKLEENMDVKNKIK